MPKKRRQSREMPAEVKPRGRQAAGNRRVSQEPKVRRSSTAATGSAAIAILRSGPKGILGAVGGLLWRVLRGGFWGLLRTLRPSGARALGRFLKRPALWGFRIAAVAALIIGCIYAAQWIERYARTSDTFAIQEIEISGNTRLSRGDVLETAGLQLGMNVFDKAPDRVAEILGAHPWIASASVQRRLPGFLEIQVREHLPVATLFLDGADDVGAKGYLIGDEGMVFKELDAADPVDLPVVTGVTADRFTTDAQFQTSILLSVVALLHDWRAAGLWRRSPISEIHLERGDGLSVYSGEPLFFAQLGEGPFRQKLRRLRKILDRLDDAKTPPEYIYLNNTRRPDRVTLRLKALPELADLPGESEAPSDPSPGPT